jgi:hypothetical protein
VQLAAARAADEEEEMQLEWSRARNSYRAVRAVETTGKLGFVRFVFRVWWFVPGLGEVGFELHDEQRIGFGIEVNSTAMLPGGDARAPGSEVPTKATFGFAVRLFNLTHPSLKTPDFIVRMRVLDSSLATLYTEMRCVPPAVVAAASDDGERPSAGSAKPAVPSRPAYDCATTDGATVGGGGSVIMHVVAEPPQMADAPAAADNHTSAMADGERRRESAVYHFAHEFLQDDVPAGAVQFIWEVGDPLGIHTTAMVWYWLSTHMMATDLTADSAPIASATFHMGQQVRIAMSVVVGSSRCVGTAANTQSREAETAVPDRRMMMQISTRGGVLLEQVEGRRERGARKQAYTFDISIKQTIAWMGSNVLSVAYMPLIGPPIILGLVRSAPSASAEACADDGEELVELHVAAQLYLAEILEWPIGSDLHYGNVLNFTFVVGEALTGRTLAAQDERALGNISLVVLDRAGEVIYSYAAAASSRAFHIRWPIDANTAVKGPTTVMLRCYDADGQWRPVHVDATHYTSRAAAERRAFGLRAPSNKIRPHAQHENQTVVARCAPPCVCRRVHALRARVRARVCVCALCVRGVCALACVCVCAFLCVCGPSTASPVLNQACIRTGMQVRQNHAHKEAHEYTCERLSTHANAQRTGRARSPRTHRADGTGCTMRM